MSDKPDSDGPGFDPLTGMPRLPAAFRGRRRFSLRSREPEPVPPDERAEFLARARAWTEDDVGLEPAEPEPDREPVKAFLGLPEEEKEAPPSSSSSSSEPRYVYGLDEMPSSGLVIEEDEPVSEDDPLPRLRVAGASIEEGPELPRPPEGEDWPTETPPERRLGADFARGAAESLGASESPPPQFGAWIRPPRPGRALGHTLAPRDDLDALEPAKPPPADPRPSLQDAGRFPVPRRPQSGPRAPTPPPTQMPVPAPQTLRGRAAPSRPSPLPRPAEVPEPSVEVEVELEPDASSSIHLGMADLVESREGPGPGPVAGDLPRADEETHVFTSDELPPEELAPGVNLPVGGEVFVDDAELDEDERPDVGRLAAVGCLVAFATFGTVGAITIAVVLSMG